ncbi:uncharacterized protein LOC108654786 isoform X5 [Drosophila navojoa]|uniref:uncharacterized protein LOC108654786 isoform X5 n=1 Tax=Drosophila navojoa TaxID=7232 RepID=UPI0011BDBABD|nr:uncharacterized protein LOC108654786 isoform X5 [Drosophila navojoa]
MSKKMWHKIFKSKSQKQQQPLSKINKRHSRGIYEEYQQLNELLNGEKSQAARFASENENENVNENGKANGNGSNCCSSSGNINVFEQQPLQSSFNSLALSEAQQQQQQSHHQQQQQQSQQLSTFSRVRNTFSLRRNSSNNNNSSSSNKKQTPNAKSTTMDSDGNLDDEPVGPKPGPLTTGFSEILQEQEVVCSTQLLACPNCSRTFNTNALRKHVVVCEKMLKKRKVFDSSRQRREGTSLSTYVLPKNFGLPNAEKAPGVHTPPTASREASTVSSSGVPHEASPLSIRRKSKTDMTRASLRKGAGAGTAATVGVAAAGPANAEPQATSAAAATAPPTLSRDRSRASDRSITRRIKDTATEHCPHCERNFNIKAFDRHVEWCKEKAIQANIKSNNTAETNKAKERMEARKKYRPPNLKTKRSINRDKYSGAQEEHFEPEPVAVKQNLMTLSTMTSSVQSDNSQRNAPQQRPGTPQVFDASKSKASLGQSKAGARMLTEELSSVVYQERVRRRQQYDACQEIDEAVERLRHPSYEQLAQLDCVEAAHLQPARSHRRPSPHRSKFDSTECMAGQPQVTMTFEELNGLIKCKGATNICNIQMDIEDHVAPKVRTSTSLVRQARRRIRTQENPNIPLRQLEPPTEFVDEHQHQQQQHQRQRPSHSPAAFRRIANDRYSGSESEDALPHAEIQIKMETSTMRSLSRPRKRIQLPVIINSSEPMRALPLPLPPAKQKPEAKGDSFLPAIDMKGEVQAQMDSDGEAEQDYDEEDIEVGQLLSKAKLLEGQYNDDIDDSVYGEVEPPAAPASLKKRATPSNVSRRLVVLEQDEEGTMYIKAPRSPTNSKKSARAPIKRSNSNTSIGNESFKSPQASTGSYKTPNGSGSYKTSPTSAFKSPLSSSDEKLDRQLSNVSGTSSSSNCYVEKTQKSVDESKKREIFISIETEANAQGRSPISPDSLRHMVGNAQTPIDVLHIENGNEPEHAKFSKISDNEDPIDDETSRAHYPNRLSPAVTSPLPNVEANNAKNVIEKMRNDFKQLGEEASASVRRDILQRQEQAQQKQQMPTQQEVKGMTPSPSGDSDELSSLDGYPMSSSQSSRRGGSSKLSTDSAYGSSNSPYCLSRQRSTELQSNMSTPRTPSQLRPHTASGAIAMSTKQPSNMMDASTQAQSNYGTLKARQRMFAPNGLGICSDAGNGNMEYSSSSSEQLMQQQQEQHQQHHKQNTNYNYIQQQQQSQPQVANNNSNSYELNALNLKNNNCNSVGVGLTPTTSQHSLQSNNSNASVKMSKFCHECGAKFVLEHAKFCMECGVRRVVL